MVFPLGSAPPIACSCRARTAAGGGRPQAGLEDVEELLTNGICADNTSAWAWSSTQGIVAL
jgi:hypothetical protein